LLSHPSLALDKSLFALRAPTVPKHPPRPRRPLETRFLPFLPVFSPTSPFNSTMKTQALVVQGLDAPFVLKDVELEDPQPNGAHFSFLSPSFPCALTSERSLRSHRTEVLVKVVACGLYVLLYHLQETGDERRDR
jgi:hypothetical protein